MDYCEDTFGTLVADEFQEEVMRVNRLLIDNPYLGIIDVRLKFNEGDSPLYIYRSIVVNKNYRLVYRVDENAAKIYIVVFWNCHRNPTLLYDEIADDLPPTSLLNEESQVYY